MLPYELRIYILKIRNNIRNNASNKIQNAWRNYILLESIAVDYALNIKTDEYNEIMVSLLSTATILKYCLSICSGKYYLQFWKNLAERLSYSLEIYKYANDEYLTMEVVNYRKIKVQYNKLLKKFNFEDFKKENENFEEVEVIEKLILVNHYVGKVVNKN